MMKYLVVLVIVIAVVHAQNPNLRGRKKNARQRMKDGGKMEEGQIVQALDIAYPLKFFAADNTDNWRSQARYSTELEQSSKDGEYKKHTLAQDQEDIWLYVMLYACISLCACLCMSIYARVFPCTLTLTPNSLTTLYYYLPTTTILRYENWFYGMKGGVIMESGALNGLTFSTSYMFETFADWTALHVEADPENYKNLRGNREQAVNVRRGGYMYMSLCLSISLSRSLCPSH